MTRGRPALVPVAAGLALAIPASAEAELRFRPPGVRVSGRWRTEADNVGPLRIDGPGALNGVLRVREDEDLSFRVRGRLGGRRVRARLRIPSRYAELFAEFEDGGGSARAAAFGGLAR